MIDYKAVIFDLDGTLFDSLCGIAYSINSVLKRNGLPTHSNDFYRSLIGEGAKELIIKSIPHDKLSVTLLSHLIPQIRKEYAANWDCDTKIYDGITELLGYLSENDIPFAVNTSKETEIAAYMIKKLFPSYRFSAVVGKNTNCPDKPDPTGALSIAQTLNISPCEMIFIGDSEADMLTAENAEMFSVGALWGYRTEEHLMKAGACCTISEPMDLIYHLEQQSAIA